MFSKLNMVIALVFILPPIAYLLDPGFQYSLGSLELTASRVLGITTFVMVYVVASVGLNVQVGFAGQLNLGYAGFMAIGAYAAAIWQVNNPDFVQNHELLTVLICLMSAFFASSLVGLLICMPTLRLRGDYFAIVTFGFAELVRQFVKNEQEITGGSNGLPELLFVPQLSESLRQWFEGVFGAEKALDFDAHIFTKYLFFLLVVTAVIWIVTQLRDSHFGRALFALRDNATAAESCGISPTFAKTGAFLISAGFGGVAGYLYIVLTSIASPDDYTFMISVFVVCCIVLGGLGSVRGSVVGALVLMSLGEFLRDLLEALPRTEEGMPLVPAQARIIFFGLVLVLMMRFRPNGIVTLESDARRLAKNEDLDELKSDGLPSPYFQIRKKQ